MSFDNPGALWLLALAAPIVAAHFFRGRRRPLYVPSVLFWDQVIEEEERRFALRRLRRYISLILNLAALAILVSMLAGPRVEGWTHEPQRVGFVVDTTLSMAAGDRMRRAREYVERSLASLHRSDEAALFDSAGLVVPFTRDRGRILGALERPPRWAGGGADVAQLVRDIDPGARVETVSDQGSLPNAAVVGARVEGEKAVVRLAGFGAAGEATLTVEGDGRARGSAAARVPGEAAVDLPDAELVRVVRTPPDAQPLDDAAYFVLPPREPPDVLVLSESRPDPFLLRALELLRDEGFVGEIGNAPLSRYPEIRGKGGEGLLIIADGGDLGELGPGVFLCFGSQSREWELGAAADPPDVADWDRGHPVLESVDPTGVAVREARLVSGGRELLRAGAGAIAAAGGGSGRAWAAFGFRLAASDLRLRPAFPLLLRNYARWARAGAARAFPRRVEAGGTLENLSPLSPPEGRALIEWTDGKNGMREEVEYRNGTLRRALVVPGFYRVSAGGRSEWTAVPHAPPAEVDLRTAAPPREPPPALRWYQDLPYVWVAGVLLLALLLAEWLLYQKGLI